MKLYDKHFFHTMIRFFSINDYSKKFCFEIACFNHILRVSKLRVFPYMKLYDKHFFHTMIRFFSKNDYSKKKFFFEIACFNQNTNQGFFVMRKPRE